MSRLFPPFVGGPGAAGLLILRLVAGSAFILHGWPKIQHPMNWMGERATMPGFMQALGAAAEFGGGAAWILGVLTPLASLLIACTMLTAITTVHLAMNHAFVASSPGQPSYEAALGYFAIAVTLLLVGPGAISLDALFFGRLRRRPLDATMPSP